MGRRKTFSSYLIIEKYSFTEEIDKTKSTVDETAHQEVIQEVHRVQTEYEDLQQRHDAQIRDNAQLSRYVEWYLLLIFSSFLQLLSLPLQTVWIQMVVHFDENLQITKKHAKSLGLNPLPHRDAF